MNVKAGFTRFEYIGPRGREVTLYGSFEVHVQDDGKTVKVFGSEPAKINSFIERDDTSE